jgi:hypothetical protein
MSITVRELVIVNSTNRIANELRTGRGNGFWQRYFPWPITAVCCDLPATAVLD